MNNDVAKLLRDTASIFAQLASAFEDEHRRLNDRIDHLENKTKKNKETLKNVAQMILDNLD